MDRATRIYTEKRTVSIVDVDMTNYLVHGRDQFGTLLQISFHLSDTMTSIPAMGETWTVERQGSLWFLDMRGDDGSEATSLTDLGPGDRRIDTSGTVWINGNAVNVNGSPVITGPTIPSTVITGLATSSQTTTLTGSNVDLNHRPAGSTYHQFTANSTVGGSIRSFGALPETGGCQLGIRNGAGSGTLTIKHATLGGPYQPFFIRTAGDLVLQPNESATFQFDGFYWVEQSRDQALPVQAVTLICSAVVAGATQANFDTNTILGGNIPSIYNSLLIRWFGRCDNAVLQQNVICQFNGDTGSNYNIGGGIFGSSYSNFATNAIAAAHLGSVPGSTQTAGSKGQGEAFIHGYTSTAFRKTITGTSSTPQNVDGSGQHEPRTFGSEWKNTAALTRIVAFPSVGNWITGSGFFLYGLL